MDRPTDSDPGAARTGSPLTAHSVTSRRPARRSWVLPVLVLLPWLVLLVGCAAPTDRSAPPDGRQRPSSTVSPAPAASTPSPAPTTASAAGRPAALPIGAIGNLGVTDQRGDGTRIRLAAEIDGSAGWVVVQADRRGRPGRVLGLAHRADGEHDDVVVVRLRPAVGTGRLWVTLCLDRGLRGVFESPGPDTPLVFAGDELRRSVTLTMTPSA